MKKKIALIAIVVLTAVLLTACLSFKLPSARNLNPLNKLEKVLPGKKDEPAKSSAATESYTRYIEMKGEAYERLFAKLQDNPELIMQSLSLLPVTFMDYTLIPLTVLGEDEVAARTALTLFGAKNLKIKKSGNDSELSYTDNDGETIVFAVSYDPKMDSLKGTITQKDDFDSLLFEYVSIGNGYVSQYLTRSKDSEAQVIRAFFDEDNIVAFGFSEQNDLPASIYQNDRLDLGFVRENSTSYFVLKDGEIEIKSEDENEEQEEG